MAVLGNVTLPPGDVLQLLYAIPLLFAANVWRPRAVGLLAALVAATRLATGRVQEAPVGIALVGLLALALVGALATQAARLRVAVQEAGRARDDFVAAAAHDLKNPLTTIRGQAQLLSRRAERLKGLEAPQREGLVVGLERIDAAAIRTLALLNALLDAVRLEAGQSLDLVTRPIDLVALARQVAATYQDSTDCHRIVVQTDLSELVGIWDGFRVERVVENLLSNALKYSPAGGEITISIHREMAPQDHPRSYVSNAGHPASATGAVAAWAALAVRDQGMGIPAADLRRVFERYHRSRNVAGTVPGMGIGLAGARRIVEQHGGTIAVQSVEGAGSTFTVRLPLPPADQPPPDTNAAAAAG